MSDLECQQALSIEGQPSGLPTAWVNTLHLKVELLWAFMLEVDHFWPFAVVIWCSYQPGWHTLEWIGDSSIIIYIQIYMVVMLRASMPTYCCATVSVISLVGSVSQALFGCVCQSLFTCERWTTTACVCVVTYLSMFLYLHVHCVCVPDSLAVHVWRLSEGVSGSSRHHTLGPSRSSQKWQELQEVAGAQSSRERKYFLLKVFRKNVGELKKETQRERE